ncbi:hypothetical protein [Micromonospora sp. NPDC050495]|uniref:hypothetical protein n=1 Tax=Micromonospora sp. NPDC050495 TaxID=3154936 RepID=UPI0033EAEC61
MNVSASSPTVGTARLRSLRRVVASAVAAVAGVGLSACAEGHPEPTGSDAPAAVTTAAPVGTPDAPAPATVLTGTRYYLDTTGTAAEIHAVRGDVDRVTARVPLGAGSCIRNTITISPYGERLAWVEGGVGQDAGTLVTSMIDGSRKRVVERQAPFGGKALCLGSNPLVWNTNDLLMVEQARMVPTLIDVAENKPADGDAGNETLKWWSADGRSWAAVSEGKPYATGGRGAHFYHYTPPKAEAARYDGWRVRSVSMDGRYVAVGWMNTDPSREDGSFAVVDTTTSKVVELPGTGQVRSILFASDDKVIVRRATGITVLDKSFRPLGAVEEPAAVRDMALLAYVP